MSTEPPLYWVYVGVYGSSNPGPHAIAMVVLLGDKRNEWAAFIGRSTTPNAWNVALEHALTRVNRPHADVCIGIRDQNLARNYTTERTNTVVRWLPKADGHPEMERAHELARDELCRKGRAV